MASIPEEKTAEGSLFGGHHHPALSWTNSEQEFGEQNYIRYEPEKEVVQLVHKETQDWNALVLYLRKDDIVANADGSSNQAQTIQARTFVYGRQQGQDSSGEAKWRKVPLQVIMPGSLPVFAKSPVAIATKAEASSGNDHEEAKQQENYFVGDPYSNTFPATGEIPDVLSFGEGPNDPVKPLLLRNDLQAANQNMKNMKEHHQQQQQVASVAIHQQHLESQAMQPLEEIEQDYESEDESETPVAALSPKSGILSDASTQLSLTKTQTIKALSYLKRVTELRKKRTKSHSSTTNNNNNNNKKETDKNNTQSTPKAPDKTAVAAIHRFSCLDRIEEHEEDIVTSGHESVEVATLTDEDQKQQRSFEDDQTALLDHACGLRDFCQSPIPYNNNNNNNNGTEEDNDGDDTDDEDQEICFDDDAQEGEQGNSKDAKKGPAPVPHIDITSSILEGSVLTAPTMNSPRKHQPPFPEQQRDNMRTVMLKLLKNKKQKKRQQRNQKDNSGAKSNSVTGEKQAGDKQGAKNHRGFFGDDYEEDFDEENLLGKSSSSSEVEAALAEMGYTKISEIDQRIESEPKPKLDSLENDPLKEQSKSEVSGEEKLENDPLIEESKTEASSETNPGSDSIEAKESILVQNETKQPVLDPVTASGLGMAAEEIEKQLSLVTEKLAIIGQRSVDKHEVDTETENFSTVAAVEVNYLPRQRRRKRGRFKRSKKYPALYTAPTAESMFQIEANADNNKEVGMSVVTLVRKKETQEKETPLPKKTFEYLRARKQKALAKLSANGRTRPLAKGARSIATKSIAGNSIANEYGMSGSIATASILENDSGVVETQDVEFEDLLSFNESKVRERVATHTEMEEDEAPRKKCMNVADTRAETKGNVKRKSHIPFGGMFKTSSKSKDHHAPQNADQDPAHLAQVVEVCEEATDTARIEMINMDPNEECYPSEKKPAKSQTAMKISNLLSKGNGMVKALSLSMSKSTLTPSNSDVKEDTASSSSSLHEDPEQSDDELRGPAFLSKRPTGIDTACHSYEVAQNNSGVSMVTENDGLVMINSDENESAVEASLGMITVPDTLPATVCCAAHQASPAKKRLPKWHPNASSSASEDSCEYSALPKLPNNLPRGKAVPAAGAYSRNTDFDTYTFQTYDNTTHLGVGLGANCAFFDSYGPGQARSEDEEITVKSSTSQGDIIEVARKRIEADEAQEKALLAAEFAAQAAREAAKKFQQATAKSVAYNARKTRSQSSPTGSLIGRHLRDLPVSPRSNVDPPAAMASDYPPAPVEIYEPEIYDERNEILALPPPPPPTSPRRKRSSSKSPRRQARTSASISQEAFPESPTVHAILEELEQENQHPRFLPPPPPPPPPSQLSPRRRQQSPRHRSLLPPRSPIHAADSTPIIKPTKSAEGRFGWIKSMLPKSQKALSASDTGVVVVDLSAHESHRPLLGEEHHVGSHYKCRGGVTTGASADGSQEIVVELPDTYLL